MLDTQEFLRVVNEDDTPLELGFHNRRYMIAPHDDAFVPFEAVVVKFGDPRSQNHGVRYTPDSGGPAIGVPPRREVIAQLELAWGHLGADKKEDPRSLRERMPNVKVYTMEGQEVVLPADDPECERGAMPLDVTVADTDISIRMAKLERELSALRSIDNRAKAQVVSENDEPSEDPENIKEDGEQPSTPPALRVQK